MSNFTRAALMMGGFVLSALPLQAADNHSYRNGQSYASMGVASAQMCEMSCAGDAQCHGWNFLRAATPAGGGLCELNAANARPTPHPFAVSGDNNGPVYANGQVVPGNTRTFRIGNPQDSIVAPVAAPRTAPRTTQRAAPGQMQASRPPQRRPIAPPVVRKRVFAPMAPMPAPNRAAQSPLQAPHPSGHPLTQRAVPASQGQTSHIRSQQQPRIRPQMDRRVQTRPQAPAAPHLMPASHRRPVQNRRQGLVSPFQGHPPQSQNPQGRSMQSAPQASVAPAVRRSNPAPTPAYTPPFAPQSPSLERGPKPLYGSLYDVPPTKAPATSRQTALTQTARPQTATTQNARAQNVAAPAWPQRPGTSIARPAAPKPVKLPLYSQRPVDDVNAPVTTSAAIPTKPVTRTALGLAGPAPQNR